MFTTGQVLDGIYQVDEKIGQGGTGIIYSGWHLRLDKAIVIKRLRGTHNARLEADILKNLHHPGLPQVYDFIEYGSDVYIIMDWIPGYSLDRWLEKRYRVDTQTALKWLQQLLDILEYLHSRKPIILHNDIKPDNIMLRPNGELCLIDFNVSMYADSGAITGYTAGFASPEQVQLAQQLLYHQEPTISLDESSDLYALGATMYALISGRVPPENGPVPPLQSMQGCTVAPELCRIIDKAMSPQKEKRYANAKKMKTALQNYVRYAGHYRTYLFAQTVCWSIGLLFFAAGIYFLASSIPQRQIENFQSCYNQYNRVLASGNMEHAGELALDILSDNTYTDILEENPQILCAMLHETGNAYYDAEDYQSALQFYQQAVDSLTPDVPDWGVYYCDAALAAAKANAPIAAEQLLAEAKANGVDEVDILLTEAAAYAANQDTAACAATAEALLQQVSKDSAYAQQCARVCLLAADVSETNTEALGWMQRACTFQEDRITLRQLGVAAHACYMEHPSLGRQYLELSAQCFAKICNSGYPTRRDRLNLAAVQVALERYNDCRETLRALEADYPGDFEILVELALVSRLQGESQAAQQYLGHASDAWEKMSEEQKNNVSVSLRDQYEELLESEAVVP